MAVHLVRYHRLPLAQARAIVQQVAQELERDLNLHYAWNGNRLEFHRTGIKGHITVDLDRVEVYIQKSFLLPVSEHWIREQVEQHLERHFPQ